MGDYSDGSVFLFIFMGFFYGFGFLGLAWLFVKQIDKQRKNEDDSDDQSDS